MLDGFYIDNDDEATFLYWTQKAREYDGFDWDNPDEELGFWLHIVYQLCDHHYDTDLWRYVRRVIVIPMRKLYGLDKPNEVMIG